MQLKKWIRWGMVVAWMALIFSFSAQQGSTSGSLSGSIVDFILSVIQFMLPSANINRETLHFLIRKGAHFTVYLVLGGLSAHALSSHQIKGWKRFLYALLISTLYAISDEIHQGFVPGRGPSIRDVLIDSAGAATGAGFYQQLMIWLKIAKH